MPVKDFDLATRLNTVPALVDRVYNRPTIETLTNKSVLGAVESKSIKVTHSLYSILYTYVFVLCTMHC